VHNLGEILRDAGQYDEGADLLRRSIALSQELGSSLWVGQTTHSLADLELDRGDLDQAASLYRECLGNAVLSGLERHKVYCIAGLAAIAARRGHDDLAMRLWQGVQRAEQTLDFRLLTGERRRYERYLEHLRVPESGAPSLDVATALAFEAGP
jgi:tetratricopeptide (TPR) repeat protein